MVLEDEFQLARHEGPASGFSLLELLASVTIIVLLMGAVFSFMFQTQKRLQGSLVVSESNQTARAAMELMTQEIGQAGFNPQYTDTKTVASGVTPSPSAQCITLNNITGINPGDWVVVDSGDNYEVVEVLATTNGIMASQSVCGAANQIKAVFKTYHDAAHSSAMPFPVASYQFPYPGGILSGATVSWGGTNITVSNDHLLAFYGDINNDRTINYVVYSLYNPTSGTPPQVTVNGTTYNLYSLYRSITPVTFNSGATIANHAASAIVENVMYQDITSVSNPKGPTGQPIFAYPNTVTLAITPSTVSVVGTVVINLCVAVNPKALEQGNVVQWYTMATQIRPVNLWASVTVNVTGGSKYLVQSAVGLPMAFPSSLSNYYF